jgi:hypothetical protein
VVVSVANFDVADELVRVLVASGQEEESVGDVGGIGVVLVAPGEVDVSVVTDALVGREHWVLDGVVNESALLDGHLPVCWEVGGGKLKVDHLVGLRLSVRRIGGGVVAVIGVLEKSKVVDLKGREHALAVGAGLAAGLVSGDNLLVVVEGDGVVCSVAALCANDSIVKDEVIAIIVDAQSDVSGGHVILSASGQIRCVIKHRVQTAAIDVEAERGGRGAGVVCVVVIGSACAGS